MSAPTLPEFLLARIAEDEAVAESAANLSNGGRWWVDGPAEKSGKWWIYDVGEKFTDRAVAGHIARHDPARVLADCESKRRIVEQAVGIAEVSRMTGREDVGGDAILRALALPYADHPDYREEWKS